MVFFELRKLGLSMAFLGLFLERYQLSLQGCPIVLVSVTYKTLEAPG